MEKKFLELIQYNVTVNTYLYARYYFELRILFKDNETEFPIKVLTKNDAAKIELNSIMLSSQMERPEVKDRLISTFGGISSKPM